MTRGIYIFPCLLFFVTTSFAQAMGGWMQYEYSGMETRFQTYTYHLNIYQYYDKINVAGSLKIWDAGTGAPANVQIDAGTPVQFSLSNVFTTCAGNSSFNNKYSFNLRQLFFTVPINQQGYYITVSSFGRLPSLVNIYDPVNTGVLFIAKIPGTGDGPSYYANSSPNISFNDTISVCRNSRFSVKMEATDPDGDSLSYSFDNALTSNFDPNHLSPEIPVDYYSTYTGNEPMGPSVAINSVTGIIAGTAPDITGMYLMAVYVKEWRKGVLINTTKKEFEIKVVDCPYTHPILKPLYSSCKVQTFNFAPEPTCPAITNYRWDFGDPTTLGDTSVLANPTYTYPGKGPYTLSLKISNNNGFLDSATSVVKVFDSISVILKSDTAICSADTIQLFPTSNATSYLWRESGNGNTLSAYNLKSPRAIPPAGITKYFVTGMLNSCSDSANIIVRASPYPKAYAGADTAICAGSSVMLNGAVSGAFYTWAPIGSLTNVNSLHPLAFPQKTTIYTLSVRDTFYCPKTVTNSVLVKVIPGFTVDAGMDASVVLGQPYQLNATTTGNTQIVKYAWQPSAYLNNSMVSDPVATINSLSTTTIPFTVKATTVVGSCTATDIVVLKVYGIGPDILMPTGFTPNGDGKNDVLKPILVGIRRLDFFTVYNRYGKVVFTTSEEGKGWDGTYNSSMQEGGSYVFVAQGVDYLGKVVIKKGTVVLIR